MTKQKISHLLPQLEARFPQLRAAPPLMVLPPVRELIRGILFERSSARDQFYINVFVMATCVPSRTLVLSLGWRLRKRAGRTLWDSNDSDLISELSKVIEEEALPFLNRAKTTSEAACLAVTLFGNHTPYLTEVNAYLLARSGQVEQSLRSLRGLIGSLTPPAFAWQADTVARAKKLEDLLCESSDLALAQLKRWESETIQALKLERFSGV